MTTAINPAPHAPALDIGIGGMTCASCVGRVEKALKKVPGVTDATVNLATESARITFAGGEQMEARLRRAVRDAGYEPRSPEQMDAVEDASPWAGFGPVAIGLLLSAPLVLPMIGAGIQSFKDVDRRTMNVAILDGALVKQTSYT